MWKLEHETARVRGMEELCGADWSVGAPVVPPDSFSSAQRRERVQTTVVVKVGTGTKVLSW